MAILSVSNLDKSYGGRTIFEGASFTMEEGERVGLIGVNGSGKSTLLRIIAGLEGADAGDIALQRGVRVGYLPQEPDLTPGHTIRYAVAEGRPELLETAAAYDAVSSELSTAPPTGAEHDRLLARQAELTATLDRLGGWDWNHRVEAMLTRLGVTGWDRAVDGLSGGEARRVALARTLLAQPGLLLLDEPTNHLDADTVLFLEEYLMDYDGAILLITHDRYFLDRLVDRMIEISAEGVAVFPGGYTEYLEAQAARTATQAAHEAKRRRLIEKELEWARRAPPARTGKSRGRLKRADALSAESRAWRRRQAGALTMRAPEAPRLGRTVLDLHGIHKAYGDRVLVRGFDAMLRAGERVGVIGPNGAGKTTLVRIVMGEEAADAGRVEPGVNTRIAYFDQLRTAIDSDVAVYDAIGGTDWIDVGGRRVHARSYLEDFLFPTDRQQQKVSSLSGGERNRLMLAKLFMQPSNLLILDEPTNDLDLLTLQVLEAALLDYAGCVLMVTHDRYFLDRLATALFVFEGDGIVHRHEGNFELYRRLREQRERGTTAQAVARAPRADVGRSRAAQQQAAAQPKLTWKEQRELETLEERIVDAEGKRAALEHRLADPRLYEDTTEAARVTAAYGAAQAEVESLYDRWAELAERAG
jgi:ABC transport system ATP-binding/permease protein